MSSAVINQSGCTIEMPRKFKLENNMAASERLQTLSEFKEEKENFPSEVRKIGYFSKFK